MKAYNVNDKGKAYPDNDISAWNETVTISINQEPNYLYLKDSDSPTKLKSLSIRSISLFGGVGLPLLPPLVPWFATLGIWTIEVQGEIKKFEVQDIDNEVHSDPIFGHGAQVYIRKNDFGIIDSVTDLPIGDNLLIKFSFVTGTFIIVPPSKPIRDKTGGIIETSPNFGKILREQETPSGKFRLH